MINLRRSIPPLGCMIALALFAPIAAAEWPANGLKVGSVPAQHWGLPTADGKGGAFIATTDYFDYDFSLTNVRLYRVAADGTVPPGWTAAGLAIADGPAIQFPCGAALGADGALTLSYVGASNYRLQATRISSSGDLASGWPATAPMLAPNGSGQDFAHALAMPDGGSLFAFWNGFSSPDIWMQRLTATGDVAPGWSVAGREFVGGPGSQVPGHLRGLIADDAEGAWFTYASDLADTEGNVYVARVDGLGNPAPGWPQHGKPVTSALGIQVGADILQDGAGGVYVTWMDARSRAGQPMDQAEFGYDVYMQRFNGAGEVVAGWPVDGLAVCTTYDWQPNPQLVPDGSGGVFVAWENSGPQGATIHAQRILANGTVAPGWPEGGKRMFGLNGYAYELCTASDQQNGLFLTCSIQSPDYWHVWVQHVNAAGNFDAPWGSMGMRVANAAGVNDNQEHPHMTVSHPGSVIVCWDDSRAGYVETYVQRITVNGLVATELSLASQDVTPDRVMLEWSGADAMLASASLERRAVGDDWRVLSSIVPDAMGRLSYADHDVAPGASYDYRLSYVSGGERRTSAITTLTVPAATPFALTGARPNPASRGRVTIAYSLATRGSARLELFDAQGRMVAGRDVTSLGAGAHTVTLDDANALRSGLYWARLSQGDQHATARVVVVD